MSNETLIKTKKLFYIFSDVTRLKIIELLIIKEHCVHEIVEALTMEQSTISHQLSLLRTQNIVQTRRQGKHIFYTLKDDHIKTIYQMGKKHAQDC